MSLTVATKKTQKPDVFAAVHDWQVIAIASPKHLSKAQFIADLRNENDDPEMTFDVVVMPYEKAYKRLCAFFDKDEG